MIVPKALLSEEEFGGSVLREAAKVVNFVWLLAWVHRRPEALRFFILLARALAPHLALLGRRPVERKSL